MANEMNKCDEIRHLLVDYADGKLEREVSGHVQSHINECEDCREELWSLDHSLKLAMQVLAERSQPQNRTPRKKIAFGRLAVAASIIVVLVGFAVFIRPRSVVVDNQQLMTYDQAYRQVQREEAVARLLYSAKMLAQLPAGQSQAKDLMQRITSEYGDTMAGQNINTDIENKGEIQ